MDIFETVEYPDLRFRHLGLVKRSDGEYTIHYDDYCLDIDRTIAILKMKVHQNIDDIFNRDRTMRLYRDAGILLLDRSSHLTRAAAPPYFLMK